MLKIQSVEDAKTISEAGKMVSSNQWAFLDTNQEDGEFKRLQDILLTLNYSNPQSNKQFIISNHAYAILDSEFRNANNKRPKFSAADLQNLDTSKIDPLLSMVTVRNPHAAVQYSNAHLLVQTRL